MPHASPKPGSQPNAPRASDAIPLGYRIPPLRARIGNDLYFPNRLRDLFLPVGFLSLGSLLLLLILLHWNADFREILLGGWGLLLVQYLILAALTRVLKLGLGTLPSALLKLGAICVFPASLMVATIECWPDGSGLLLGVPLSILIATLMAKFLFDLGFYEAALCTVLVGLFVPASVGGWWLLCRLIFF